MEIILHKYTNVALSYLCLLQRYLVISYSLQRRTVSTLFWMHLSHHHDKQMIGYHIGNLFKKRNFAMGVHLLTIILLDVISDY